MTPAVLAPVIWTGIRLFAAPLSLHRKTRQFTNVPRRLQMLLSEVGLLPPLRQPMVHSTLGGLTNLCGYRTVERHIRRRLAAAQRKPLRSPAPVDAHQRADRPVRLRSKNEAMARE